MKLNNKVKRVNEKYNLVNHIIVKKIKEGLSSDEALDDINMKLNVVMDALGLEFEEKEIDDKVDNKDVDTDTIDTTEELVEETTEEEEVPDTFVSESIDNEISDRYVIEMLPNAKYKYWYNDVNNSIKDNKIGFSYLDNVIMFLEDNHIPISADTIINADKETDSGEIYTTPYFKIYKK